MIDAALAAKEMAYAPYSGFAVGAAVLSEGGSIFIGCNVENASYGLTQCAERAAVATAIAAGENRFRLLTIASRGGAAPCGACRQVLAEFCDDLPILLVDVDRPKDVVEVRLKDIFPARFDLKPQHRGPSTK